jgi:Tol biopolymer transport system component
VDVITGKKNSVFESKDQILHQPVWLPDGGNLLALSLGRETGFTRQQIVEISTRDRTSRPITHDVNDYSALSLSGDGRTVATVLNQDHFDLFVSPASNLTGGQLQQMSSGSAVYGFSWTPGGQLILSRQTTLTFLQADTGSQSPLNPSQEDGGAGSPAACPNGRYILFSFGGQGGGTTLNIWRMDAGGGNLKQLSKGTRDDFSVCSPDGKSAFYTDLSNGGKITRVPLEGGTPERISEFPAYRFALSPDGKVLAFATFTSSSDSRTRLAVLPVDSVRNTRFLDPQRRLPVDGTLRFSPDGKSLVYATREQDTDNLWLQPLDGSPGKQLTNFKSEQITDFRWSFDGSKLGMVRGHTDSDVVLLQESKP